ncbi:MAG: hypothetical protein Q8J92_08535 [Parvibaculum sp.]|nr:hypothetical protein [Parvibaculum sp.]
MRISLCILGLVLGLSFMPLETANASCVEGPDGLIPGPGLSICKADASRLVISVVELGFCENFPDVSSDPHALSSCNSILESPVDVDLQIGTAQSVPISPPQFGSYPYNYRLIKSAVRFAALFKFGNDVIGGTGASVTWSPGDPSSYNLGKHCQPPSFSYDLRTYSSGVLPNKCTDEAPIGLTLAELHINNVGLLSWEPISSTDTPGEVGTDYFVNPNAFQNAFILDSGRNVASNQDSAEYILIVQKSTGSAVIDDSTSEIRVKFQLTNAVRATVSCGHGFAADCVFITPFVSAQASAIEIR